jgi:hypothetical protein
MFTVPVVGGTATARGAGRLSKAAKTFGGASGSAYRKPNVIESRPIIIATVALESDDAVSCHLAKASMQATALSEL